MIASEIKLVYLEKGASFLSSKLSILSNSEFIILHRTRYKI